MESIKDIKGIKFCDQCKKQANPPPKTVKFEVNWEELGDALKNIPTGGEHSITVNPVDMTLTLEGSGETKKVAVADWDKLIAVLEAIDGQPCPECPTQRAGGEIAHNINHSTFEFRFAPPWFNADQRSLFTSYVIFPAEAKLGDLGPNRGCLGGVPASVCPDEPFHKEVTGPFLEALAQCGTEKKPVVLRVFGFASSSDIVAGVLPEPLEKAYETHIGEINGRCKGTLSAKHDSAPNRFNLLVANRRAANAAEMLRGFTSSGVFDIEDKPWCSHEDMVRERHHTDRSNGSYDSARGLMNRRAEVRLKYLSGCLNVHPDKRVVNGDDTRPG